MRRAAVPQEARRQVAEAFHQRCAYCQTAQELYPGDLEIEHIRPRAAGGLNAEQNLCLCCTHCNRRKGARMRAADPLSGRTVALFHPRKQRWQEHFTWSSDGTRIRGLTPTGRATVAALELNYIRLVNARRRWVRAKWHPPSNNY